MSKASKGTEQQLTDRAAHEGVDELRPSPRSTNYIAKTKQTVTAWKGMNGLQGGDPAKLAKALVELASQDVPPLRWGRRRRRRRDFRAEAKTLLAQANAHRDVVIRWRLTTPRQLRKTCVA